MEADHHRGHGGGYKGGNGESRGKQSKKGIMRCMIFALPYFYYIGDLWIKARPIYWEGRNQVVETYRDNYVWPFRHTAAKKSSLKGCTVGYNLKL